ncbi:BZ3500_MvSof-1268-A1-R1_Chr9g10833 [Microbotryum saponariae]|uniref:BZ3500_MvSof-1268-A1-R1_Chr9g10833 protein n=1 Tax=Microbotryum saponariae TaxID=289078 RepID=A0A2X0LWB6_9BASI|nr:BZ3501_MvSof-1269-A2-R1_Chr9g10581 [Microbotryum saponariae]SDA00775.1 BZ3500_MvSof-1268-A1-R1_Chr9g10833 [Microbotryum saponariae]
MPSPVPSTSAVPYSDSITAPIAHLGICDANGNDGEDEEEYDHDVPLSFDSNQDTIAARRSQGSAAKASRRSAISRRRPSRGTSSETVVGDGAMSPSSKKSSPSVTPGSSPTRYRKASATIQALKIPMLQSSATSHASGTDSEPCLSAMTATNNTFGLVGHRHGSSVTPTTATFPRLDADTPHASSARSGPDSSRTPKLNDDHKLESVRPGFCPIPVVESSRRQVEMPGAASSGGSANRKDYVPTLPSPLSNSYITSDDYWSSGAGFGFDSISPRLQGDFPFPSSNPGAGPYPISMSSASSTNAISAPASPFSTTSSLHDGGLSMSQSPPMSLPRRLQALPSPPIRPDSGGPRARGRGHAVSFYDRSSPSASIPPYQTSTSSSRSTSLSRANEMPLTPPESVSESGRHSIFSSTDAWHDVLGVAASSMSYANMDYSLPQGDSTAAATETSTSSKQGAADDLMSLQDTTTAPRRQSMPLGHHTQSRSAGSPADGGKRVNNHDLMAGSGGGHFGPATRELLAAAISQAIDRVPLSAEDEVVHMVEYGAMNSRSASLFPAVISNLAIRHELLRKEKGLDVGGEDDAEALSFQITHADRLEADFRPLAKLLETSSDSYLNANWLTEHRPSLENQVFSSFVTRPFGSKVMPRKSVTFGFSAMALHWLSTDRKYRMAPASIAHGELMAFLSARATEFKTGGLLALAYIARSEDKATSGLNRGPSAAARIGGGGGGLSRPTIMSASSDPEGFNTAPVSSSPESSRPSLRHRSATTPVVPTLRKDIWEMFTSVLSLAIQRLVSTQLLKPAVARQLLALPIHPRTPRQSKAVLKSMQHAWDVESEEVVKLSHPAWAGLKHETVSPASYADQSIQLLKVFWESEIRSIMREALGSRAACEFTLDCLWNVVKEKLEEEGPHPLELEVQIILLRRKPDA